MFTEHDIAVITVKNVFYDTSDMVKI